MVEFTRPDPSHVAHIAGHMREGDRLEVWATGYDDPLEALRLSLEASTHSAVALVDGEPVALIGVAPVSMLGGVGAPWMIGTDGVQRNTRALMTFAPTYIRSMLNVYPHLVNHVHAPNRTAVRWLRRVGFHIHQAEPFGPRGEMFHKFEMGS